MAVSYNDVYLIRDEDMFIALSILEMDEGECYTITVETETLDGRKNSFKHEFLWRGPLYKFCVKAQDLTNKKRLSFVKDNILNE